MINEEKYIVEKAGRRNPFLVPDGYFDGFAERMMQQLPERRQRAKSFWLRPAFYAVAASFCAVVFSVAVYLHQTDTAPQAPARLASSQELVENSFDEAADYMMIDNHDIYACLAGD